MWICRKWFRSSPSGHKSEHGFALVSVIWLAMLMAVAAFVFTTAVRSYVRSAESELASSEAEAYADGAANIAIIDLVTSARSGRGARFPGNGTAVSCRMSERTVAIIRVRDESGRVDLNVASEPLLRALLMGSGLSVEEAAQRVDALVDFRDADSDRRALGAESADYLDAGRKVMPKNAKFDAVEELGAVMGFEATFVERLRPLVTVYSGQTGLDPKAVSPELAEVIGRGWRAADSESFTVSRSDGPIPREFVSASAQRYYSIEAEVVTPRGARFVREAVVSLVSSPQRQGIVADLGRAAAPPPYLVWRWRRGISPLEVSAPDAEIPSC